MNVSKKLKEIAEISKPTGNNLVDTATVVGSSIYQDMDTANKEALLVMGTKGTEAAVKHMFNPTGDRELSYAEMRARYG
jgi:hypothetical protein